MYGCELGVCVRGRVPAWEVYASSDFGRLQSVKLGSVAGVTDYLGNRCYLHIPCTFLLGPRGGVFAALFRAPHKAGFSANERKKRKQPKWKT
eukprot:scaffold1189_cov194-Amphora_coffeaeformis.AAC.14